MSKVIAAISTSVDGYVTGPDDGPEYGLGRGGERLHHWVMGGPWTYEGGHEFAMHGPDKEFFDELTSTIAAGVVGRGMYDAYGAWGGTNPFPGTLFVVTHRTGDQPPPESGFRFVDDLGSAIDRAARAGSTTGTRVWKRTIFTCSMALSRPMISASRRGESTSGSPPVRITSQISG